MDLHMDENYGWRFRTPDWAQAGGNIQSVLFATTALRTLAVEAPWVLAYMEAGIRLVDYGCAMGDGTAVLAAAFPTLRVMGCDLTAEAVAAARLRWPTLQFAVEDMRTPTQEAHVIWTSHTLEHLADPAAAIAALRPRCHLLVGVFPVITTPQTTGPHVGAPLFADWFPTVEAPMVHTPFTTRRRDVATERLLVEEYSLLCVWRGTHPSHAVRGTLTPAP